MDDEDDDGDHEMTFGTTAAGVGVGRPASRPVSSRLVPCQTVCHLGTPTKPSHALRTICTIVSPFINIAVLS